MIKSRLLTGFTVFELLVVSCVIFTLIGTFGIYINQVLLGEREAALRQELAALRLNLKLYYILHENVPQNIGEFFDVEKGRLDEGRYLLDPFGNKYVYFPDETVVKSSTAGYENW